MRKILALLAAMALASMASAVAPQAPTAPQAPPCREVSLCPCSQSGTCECTSADSCGCTADGYRWIATSNPNQTALYRGQHQCGNYWHAEKEYKRLIDRPGEPLVWTHEPCPVAVPTRTTKPVARPATTFIRPVTFAPSFRGGNCGPSG